MRWIGSDEDGATSWSELLADLVGMVCAYPFLVISTCIRTGHITSYGAILSAPWAIVKKNGLTALWWGLVPYLLSRLVVTVVWVGVEQQLDKVEERFFPQKDKQVLPRNIGHYALRQLLTFAKAAACALAVSPLEVVTYYLQARCMTDNARALLAGCGVWCVRALWQQGGLRRFYRGLWSGIMYNYVRGAA